MADAPNNPVNAEDKAKIELLKLQIDYAWKWFAYHADQRIKMFNYMLVVYGIAAAGILTAADETKEIPPVAVAIFCLFVLALAILFMLLDRRNRDLIWLGEDVLIHLERNGIFKNELLGEGKILGRGNARVYPGILLRQEAETKEYNENRHDKSFIRKWFRNVGLGKHRVLLPLIGILMATFYASAAIWSLLRMP